MTMNLPPNPTYKDLIQSFVESADEIQIQTMIVVVVPTNPDGIKQSPEFYIRGNRFEIDGLLDTAARLNKMKIDESYVNAQQRLNTLSGIDPGLLQQFQEFLKRKPRGQN